MRECIIAACQRNAASGMRGLCLKCYSRAKKTVEAGQATWEELERMGLAESRADGTDPFDAALQKAKQQQAAHIPVTHRPAKGT